jgi:hypothetical protein
MHWVDPATVLADAIGRLHANRSLLALTDVVPSEREDRRMKADTAAHEPVGDAVEADGAGRNR